MALFRLPDGLRVKVVLQLPRGLQQDAPPVPVDPLLALLHGAAGGRTAPAAAVGAAAVRGAHVPHLRADGEGGGLQRCGLCETGLFRQCEQLLHGCLPSEMLDKYAVRFII